MFFKINKIMVIFFFLLFFYFHLNLFAREVTVIVRDTDISHPLEGALIRTQDGNAYYCDNEGKTVIRLPDGRQAVIQVSYPGYESKRLVIPLETETITVSLNLAGVMHGNELVIEASRANENESQTGRSVAINEREIAQTAQIGIIEDVMSSIKLLPGVSYTGFFDAQPSIRGGHPGDMSASFDGFYINNPYHWGGGFSIFDPKMVQSAKLSHGVFSVRYGHTISGLLEITGKKPSSAVTQFELSVNTSALNLSYSFPLAGKGGVLFMYRLTYYDPVIALAKEAADYLPSLETVKSIKKAPFIRSGALNGYYRFTENLELSLSGFFGADGVAVDFYNANASSALNSESSLKFVFNNYQGFITPSLLWNPSSNTLVKLSFGAGFENMLIDGEISNNIKNKKFSDSFSYSEFLSYLGLDTENYSYFTKSSIDQSDLLFNTQARLDVDRQLKSKIIISGGLQQMFNWNSSSGLQKEGHERWFSRINPEDQQTIKDHFKPIAIPDNVLNYFRVEVPVSFAPEAQNKLFTTSGYLLLEINFLNNRIKTEAGLRMDHYYLIGEGFSASSPPAFNPRLNIDFNILKDTGFINSFDISAGTGLFSSLDSASLIAEERFNISSVKPNRSWTSVIGINLNFIGLLSLNIETYYKQIFDRMYVYIQPLIDDIEVFPYFNGVGKAFGVDVMLHKVQSRFWDGWLSYSYNNTRYKDPDGRTGGMGISGGTNGNDWYYPYFHRFHTLNFVLNFKPRKNMNFYLRLGIASGEQISNRISTEPESYPVFVFYEDELGIIEKFYMFSTLDGSKRSTPSLSMDIKYSIYGENKNGRAGYEVYIALENVLSLIYMTQGNTSFNPYTGQMDTGSSSASYGIPIPIPSFGFKISY